MKQAFFATAIILGSSSLQAETFEQAWASRWRPQVAGSFATRRFEPHIKQAFQEVWDVAQQNVVKAADSKPVQLKAQPIKKPQPVRRRWRRRFF